ncbi:T4 RnlA family RNA ligase [Rapidithrix thailandica]|uniref:T4 RnlA family RNA ligase n=1 Tax=Rapidithrix thailandica TaxID=413964 RepID=A0AAW9RTL4_9BACT
MNISLLNQMICEGYVAVQKHPEHSLYIYNYTPKAQFDRVWNECTLACRGLIMDKEHNIIARPFRKFFNLGELEDQTLPQGEFEVYEKMDGSLGILYWAGDTPLIATRGSFTSVQAEEANRILHSDYAHCLDKLDRSKTYLFEIIYPENRIVVDYGKKRELVLLAIVDTETGREQALEALGFPLAKHYRGLKDLQALKLLEEENREGFVVKFQNGFRVKVKFEEYQRLHFLMNQVSSITIWEKLKEEQDLSDILEDVPDEFYNWVKTTRNRLLAAYQAIEQQAKTDFKVLASRKETALYFNTCRYPHVMFKMLEGKSCAVSIWRLLRPEYEKPFASMMKDRGMDE